MNRTVFLVDGFNLYHSVPAAARAFGGSGTEWLNIDALCRSYLHIVGSGATLDRIYYFSALAKHLEAKNPDVTKRHRDLIRCLEDTGINIHLARFKRKTITCNHCGKTLTRREEKETDVAIAVVLLELLHTDGADSIVILSGDTDIAPAVRTAKKLFPAKAVGFAFPYGRKNKELAAIGDFAFTITKEQYRNHQFPDPYTLKNGRQVAKPPKW